MEDSITSHHVQFASGVASCIRAPQCPRHLVSAPAPTVPRTGLGPGLSFLVMFRVNRRRIRSPTPLPGQQAPGFGDALQTSLWREGLRVTGGPLRPSGGDWEPGGGWFELLWITLVPGLFPVSGVVPGLFPVSSVAGS